MHQGLAERCGRKSTVEPPNELTALPAPKPLGADDQQTPTPTPGQRCNWCGTQFSPRRGSGGSPQKCCSAECRKISNREHQRTRRTAQYAGPTTLPATGHPGEDKAAPRDLAVAALRPWVTGVLDIADCERTEFFVALKDGETAGTRVETWPPEMRTFMEQHVSRWVEENKDKHTVRAMTVAAPKYEGIQSCVVILHHTPKRHASAELLGAWTAGRGPPGQEACHD